MVSSVCKLESCTFQLIIINESDDDDDDDDEMTIRSSFV